MVETYDVILATYNGELYLNDQLRSIERQSIPPSHVYIADDGSSDHTISIILEWINSTSISATYIPSLQYRLGSVHNFERLLSVSTANYVMLSDQDDIWDFDKAINLLSSIKNLEYKYGADIPLLAYSDLRVVDSMGNVISSSFFRFQHLYPYSNDWLSIAFQNVVTGCSCVVNRKCIQTSLPFPDEVIMHDWWLALIASSAGKTIYLPKTTINYRQHVNNVVGARSFSRLLFERWSLFASNSLIDTYIGAPILQLKACSSRVMINDLHLCSYINDLTSINPLKRILAALRLRLTKHGILRTILFYLLLLFWKPATTNYNYYHDHSTSQ